MQSTTTKQWFSFDSCYPQNNHNTKKNDIETKVDTLLKKVYGNNAEISFNNNENNDIKNAIETLTNQIKTSNEKTEPFNDALDILYNLSYRDDDLGKLARIKIGEVMQIDKNPQDFLNNASEKSKSDHIRTALQNAIIPKTDEEKNKNSNEKSFFNQLLFSQKTSRTTLMGPGNNVPSLLDLTLTTHTDASTPEECGNFLKKFIRFFQINMNENNRNEYEEYIKELKNYAGYYQICLTEKNNPKVQEEMAINERHRKKTIPNTNGHANGSNSRIEWNGID